MPGTIPNQRGTATPRGWLAYSLACHLNKLSWRLEQILFVGADIQSEAQQASRDLTPLIRALLPDPVAARVERTMLESLDNWEKSLHDERLGDWIDETQDCYIQMASGKISTPHEYGEFSDLTGMGSANVHTIREIIIQELKGQEYLQAAFHLGDTVDRGVRPPELASIEVFDFETLNEDYWRYKRTPEFLDSISRHHKEWQSYRESYEKYLDAWEDEDTLPPRIPNEPRLPEKIKIGSRLRCTRKTALKATWGTDVRTAWGELGMPSELPPVILTYYKKPDFGAYRALLSQIEKAAWEGFARLEGLVGSSDQRQTESTGCEPEFSSKLWNTTLTDSGVVSDIDHSLNRNRSTSLQSRDSAGSDPVALDARSADPVGGSITFHQTNQRIVETPPEVPAISGDEYKRLLSIKKKIDSGGKYVGESLAILQVFEKIEELNRSPDESLLILGPTGAGKSTLAELIHRHSRRSPNKFHVDQAAHNLNADFTITMVRWFGYGKNHGFPSRSAQGREGFVQQCAGGTIFLDEVADLSKEMQGLLLDVLDGKEIPLTAGEGPPIKPSVRLMFATNRDLAKAVKEGTFRHDLLDRIERRRIRIPPLNERKEDIFSFVRAEFQGRRPEFEFWLALLLYEWPGNVRELLDVLSMARDKVSQSRGPLRLDVLQLDDTDVIRQVRSMSSDQVKRVVLSKLAEMLEQRGFERGKRGAGLQAKMAEILDISPPTLSRWMRRYGLSGDRLGGDDEPG